MEIFKKKESVLGSTMLHLEKIAPWRPRACSRMLLFLALVVVSFGRKDDGQCLVDSTTAKRRKELK